MVYYYLEDFAVGDTLETHSVTMTEPEIIEFAKKFDPQPMHTDPEAAKAIMGGLIASGWHTASTTMGLFVTGRPYQPAPGSLGGGFESLKWFQPVRPGDQLRVRVEVTGVRESASKPDRGIVTSRITTLNQRDEAVQEMVSSGIIPKRNP